MRNDQKFYLCKHCGNLIGIINNAEVPLVCCGEEMQELVPNTVDAAVEKHLPKVTVTDNTVEINIGSVDHPMTAEHSILWVYLQTEKGGQRKCLNVGEAPNTSFSLIDDQPVAAFAYCNLHGLWKTEIQ